jgi:DNA-binding CsgD family transcriptional regulator
MVSGSDAVDGHQAHLDIQSTCAPLLHTLSTHHDGELVGDAIRLDTLHAWQPLTVTMRIHHAERQSLDLMVWSGAPTDLVERFASLPAEANTPDGDCLRNGRRIDIRVDELPSRYPLLAPWAHALNHPPEAEIVTIPVRARANRIGALSIELPGPPEEPVALHLTLDAVSSALALWALASEPRHPWERSRRQREVIRLTERQQRVIELVEDGWTNLAIASELNFSVATIKSELAGLMRRFGATDRHDLIERIQRSNL